MSTDGKSSAGARERAIFLGAMEKRATAERRAFVAAACGPDAKLRARVEALIKECDAVGTFLETPAAAGASSAALPAGTGAGDTVIIPHVTEKAGDYIGRYKLLQKIGEGGVGIVYMAEQEEPVRRRVALKVIKLGMDTKGVIARFEAERQALAMMDHPNIAKVLDAGATETGRPYFVMELVHGVRITEYCDEHNLSTANRLQLFIQVCLAIQHAHQKGIIHRDIKPSNILVTSHDGRPVPKVIDFGIAKATEQRLTDKTLFTEYAMFIGTPAYMSPEQAQMTDLDIDTRSDIYSLGVLLYELLIGKTPFDPEMLMRGGLDACRRTVALQEPARPSKRLTDMVAAELTTTAQQRRVEVPQLIHLMSGDLDWIAMKCLEKDRTRRYETVSALALDIQHYLDGEPVSARPPSRLYRMRKFAWRHQAALIFATAIGLTLMAGATISVWQAVRATRAEKQENWLRQQAERQSARAEKQTALARLNEYVADINLAKQSLDAGHYARAVQLLEKHRPQAGESDLRGFEWRYLWQVSRGSEHMPFPSQAGAVQAVAYSPTGDYILAATSEKLNIYQARTRKLVTSLPKGAMAMTFSTDGQTLLTASRNPREPGRPMKAPPGSSSATLCAWNIADWTEQKTLPRIVGPVAFSGHGERLASSSQSPRNWEANQGIRVWEVQAGNDIRESNWLPNATRPVAFSPDGRILATDSKSGITLWSLGSDPHPVVLPNASNLFTSFGPDAWSRPAGAMVFSPDGKWLVATRNSLSERGVFVLGIWNVATGDETTMPDDPEQHQHLGIISSLAFSPDGRLLATASMDYSIRLWDFEARQRVATLQGHLSEVWTVAFSPDGRSLVSGAKDGSVKTWAVQRPPDEELIEGPWQVPLAISKDSHRLGALRQNSLAFVNLDTLEQEIELPLAGAGDRLGFRPPGTVVLSEDLLTMVQALDDGRVQIWNLATRETHSLKVASRQPNLLALSTDGRLLAVGGGFDHTLQLWDLSHETNTVLETEAFRALFSPDNRTLAVFHRDRTAELWDVSTGALRTNLASEVNLRPDAISAFSPDGSVLAIACADDSVGLWHTTTGQLLGTCVGHKQGVFSIAFAPDGKTLATASDDSTLKLWNISTQQELLTLRRLGGALRTLIFSPDGRLLVGRRSSMTPQAGLRFYRAPSFAETDAVVGDVSP